MIHEALREPANVTQSFSSERTPTVFRNFPALEFLMKRWETMAAQPLYAEIQGALQEGLQSLQKWFNRADTTSSAYFICMVLDPTIKDTYFRTRWEPNHFKKAMRQMEQVFDRYYAETPKDAPQSSTSSNAVAETAPGQRYGSSFLLDAVKSAQKSQQVAAHPRDELKNYLSAPLESTSNVLHW
ncbi:hypothetical protein B0H10DRAFT_1038184 [Mycena sp. CBHHK59/15]|nr:hypothetical protein B0H10DRAFT_1038184 [Mycena sp. CBHHK59/15]